MPWIADGILLLCAGPLVAMALTARPTRGENLVGAHLITGPLAIGMALAWALHLLAAPLPSVLVNVLLALNWPGYVVAMTFLPLAACGGRRARWIKGACALAPSFPPLLGHGPQLHPLAPWVGAAGVLAYGAGGSLMLARPFWRRLRRWMARVLPSGPRPLSDFDQRLAAQQRERWQRLSPDASVSDLLGFARSQAPEVLQTCLARLAAHPDLTTAIADLLQAQDPDDVLHYVVHHYPRPRRELAAATNSMLATMRTNWLERLRADPSPRPWTGNVVPALEVGIAVLHDGGDVRAELGTWQRELASLPPLAGLARELARLVRKSG